MLKADHFALEVENIDRAIKFYTEKIGLDILHPKEYNDEEKAEFAFLKVDGGNLELVKLHNKKNCIKDKECICPHFSFGTDNFDEILQKLKNKGIPIFQGPFEAKNVSRWVYIKDTEGNVLEFIQWLK